MVNTDKLIPITLKNDYGSAVPQYFAHPSNWCLFQKKQYGDFETLVPIIEDEMVPFYLNNRYLCDEVIENDSELIDKRRLALFKANLLSSNFSLTKSKLNKDFVKFISLMIIEDMLENIPITDVKVDGNKIIFLFTIGGLEHEIRVNAVGKDGDSVILLKSKFLEEEITMSNYVFDEVRSYSDIVCKLNGWRFLLKA